MNEIQIQRSILDLTIAAGGYGWKMSHAMLAGIPDLFLIWPRFVPVIAEVKYLGFREKPFELQIPVTPLQQNRLNRVNAYGPFAVVLVALKWKGKDYVITYKPKETRCSSTDISGYRSAERRVGKFDLTGPFDDIKIPRYNSNP